MWKKLDQVKKEERKPLKCRWLSEEEKKKKKKKKVKTYSRGWFRSIDLWVMGPARSHCATLLLCATSPKNCLYSWLCYVFDNCSNTHCFLCAPPITLSLFVSLCLSLSCKCVSYAVDAQAQLSVAAEKERSATEKAMTLQARVKVLENQTASLRQEKSRLMASLELEKAKTETLEETQQR